MEYKVALRLVVLPISWISCTAAACVVFMYKFSEMIMLMCCGWWLFGRNCVGGAAWLHLANRYVSRWSIDLLDCLLAWGDVCVLLLFGDNRRSLVAFDGGVVDFTRL